jgi:hypothetical protein
MLNKSGHLRMNVDIPGIKSKTGIFELDENPLF